MPFLHVFGFTNHVGHDRIRLQLVGLPIAFQPDSAGHQPQLPGLHKPVKAIAQTQTNSELGTDQDRPSIHPLTQSWTALSALLHYVEWT